MKFELTREEQFIATSTRHPMRVTVKAGADKDGTLTALQLDVLSNTGAYGNHAGPVLFHSVDECIGVYNCPNKKVDARRRLYQHRAGRAPSAAMACRRR